MHVLPILLVVFLYVDIKIRKKAYNQQKILAKQRKVC